jgi:hypothetical protein
MPASTTRGALPYPLGTDPPDTDGDIRKLAERLAAVGALYLQDTASARPAAGVDGRLFLATDTGVVSYDTGSAWIDLLTQAAASAAYATKGPVASARSSPQETTTSTVPADLATLGPSVTLTVPASGKIAVDFSCAAWNDGSNYSYVHFAVLRASDLSELVAADVQRGLVVPGALETRAGLRDVVTGLTPGTQVTVRLKYWVNTGTSTFRRRFVSAHAVD